ncbi:MAG: hypothetical protein JWN70_2553 [Planctomycetaceae bacterium]|nr:hypothetical protein [Planctomycetaceae bacterium]
MSLFRSVMLWIVLICWSAVGRCEPNSPERARNPGPLAATMTEYDRINLETNLRWVVQRERDRAANQSGPGEKRVSNERVGVFADAGVWHVGARSIVEVLEAQRIPCRVLDRSLLTKDGLSGLEVLVLPGGWAPLQWAAAGDTGLTEIKTFVEGGGRCVAICAGAYLISKTTKYAGQEFPYPLGLFDGIAEGPVTGLAPFPKLGTARLKVTEAGSKRGLAALNSNDVLYSGGPCFKNGNQVVILAQYPDNTAAIIARPVGKGEVLLIGVHVERPASTTGSDSDPPPKLAHTLLKSLLFP